MGSQQIITTIQNQERLTKQLYSNKQIKNTALIAEVVTILDLVKTIIGNKDQCAIGSITIYTDYRKIINYIMRKQLKASEFT